MCHQENPESLLQCEIQSNLGLQEIKMLYYIANYMYMYSCPEAATVH